MRTCLAVALGLAVLAGCGGSDEPRIAVTRDLTCDHPLNDDRASTINERVGGLRTEDFTVRLAQSTPLGTVALVSGDFEKAATELIDEYGVSLVAELEDDQPQYTTARFAQVQEIVEEYCPA